MIYLYLFGTCFHFIYVFMIIGKYKTINIIISYRISSIYNKRLHVYYHSVNSFITFLENRKLLKKRRYY